MATVVYTRIDSISDLKSAAWVKDDQNSYADTGRAALALYGDDTDGVVLVGRCDNLGRVSVVRAFTAAAGWSNVGDWHVSLAQSLADGAVNSDAARQLVLLEAGGDAKYDRNGPAHLAILCVLSAIESLGVIGCDREVIAIRDAVFA